MTSVALRDPLITIVLPESVVDGTVVVRVAPEAIVAVVAALSVPVIALVPLVILRFSTPLRLLALIATPPLILSVSVPAPPITLRLLIVLFLKMVATLVKRLEHILN